MVEWSVDDERVVHRMADHGLPVDAHPAGQAVAGTRRCFMLSQAVGYAAIALGYVAAGGGKSILVKQIAEDSDIPASYLAKIVNSLARKGIVATQRGIGGGVSLAKPATEVTLFDLCVALDDPSIQTRCMLGTAECSDARACPAHQFWASIRLRYVDYLQRMTVADVAAFELKRRSKAGNAAASLVASLGLPGIGAGVGGNAAGPDMGELPPDLA
jgi:Rrf2 family protein